MARIGSPEDERPEDGRVAALTAKLVGFKTRLTRHEDELDWRSPQNLHDLVIGKRTCDKVVDLFAEYGEVRFPVRGRHRNSGAAPLFNGCSRTKMDASSRRRVSRLRCADLISAPAPRPVSDELAGRAARP